MCWRGHELRGVWGFPESCFSMFIRLVSSFPFRFKAPLQIHCGHPCCDPPGLPVPASVEASRGCSQVPVLCPGEYTCPLQLDGPQSCFIPIPRSPFQDPSGNIHSYSSEWPGLGTLFPSTWRLSKSETRYKYRLQNDLAVM